MSLELYKTMWFVRILMIILINQFKPQSVAIYSLPAISHNDFIGLVLVYCTKIAFVYFLREIWPCTACLLPARLLKFRNRKNYYTVELNF